MTIYDRMRALEALDKEEKKIKREYKKLSLPLCSDMGRIADIYTLYLGTPEVKSMYDEVEVRKVFVFLILSLYCPKFLSGSMLAKGRLRKEIATVLDCTPNLVSRDCRDTLFRYSHYRYVRGNIDSLFEKICRYLGIETTNE